MLPEDLIRFCKEKGFIYASSDIYGGLQGFYDYGHAGTALKKNFENVWKKFFLGLNENFHEIETANVMHEKVFEASGHLKNFIDPIIACSKCSFFARADHFLEEQLGKRYEGLSSEEYDQIVIEKNLTCPSCNSPLKKAAVFNMMFPIQLGVGSNQQAYLRPETAQSPYVNFKIQYELLRKRIPMGLALIGRAYRNEISPRNLTLRQREFTQAELQIFFNPNKINEHEDFETIKNSTLKVLLVEDREKHEVSSIAASELVEKGLPKFYVYHLVKIQEFYDNLKIFNFRLYQLDDSEKAFYNKYHFDIEVNLNGHGWTEVGGLHYRTDHDLSGHQRVSKQSMEVVDDTDRFIPHVLEVSFGVDRNVYTLLDQHVRDDPRGNLVLALPPSLAPKQVAVFPLVNKLAESAREVYDQIKEEFNVMYDKSGSVGRRYARADEVGIPLCITIDFEEGVTIRERDSTTQIRVSKEELIPVIKSFLKGAKFETLGKSMPKQTSTN